jgi:hypothetical protein
MNGRRNRGYEVVRACVRRDKRDRKRDRRKQVLKSFII